MVFNRDRLAQLLGLAAFVAVLVTTGCSNTPGSPKTALLQSAPRQSPTPTRFVADPPAPPRATEPAAKAKVESKALIPDPNSGSSVVVEPCDPEPGSVSAVLPGSPRPGDQSRSIGGLGSFDDFQKITNGWHFKMNVRFKGFGDEKQRQYREDLNEKAKLFFLETAFGGLSRLQEANPALTTWVISRIKGRDLVVEGPVETKSAEMAVNKSHRWAIFKLGVGAPRIKLGEEAVFGIIEHEWKRDRVVALPFERYENLWRRLGVDSTGNTSKMVDSVFEQDEKEARAAIFHALLHYAGVPADGRIHDEPDFSSHAMEQDPIFACTAQAYPYTALWNDAGDEKAAAPVYTNTRLACETCAQIDPLGKKPVLNPKFSNPQGQAHCDRVN